MSDPPVIGGSSSKKKPTKQPFNPLLHPNQYGYVTVQGRAGTPPKQKYTDPHGLGRLGSAQLQGVLNLFGNDPLLQGAGAAASIVGGKPFTADQVMYMFDHASPGTRGAIQAMMYRAGGLYKKKYVPTPGGPLTKADRDAFKNFIIGVAANPAQGGVGDLLSQAADNGDALGALQTNAHYKPLVREVTNPQDIMDTANQVGLKLHGTYLSPDQMKVFTSAYQTMEKAFQEQKYTAEGGDLETGYVNPDNATGATVTDPASVSAMASDAIRNADPAKFMNNTFTDRLNEVMDGLRGPNSTTAGSQVGPL